VKIPPGHLRSTPGGVAGTFEVQAGEAGVQVEEIKSQAEGAAFHLGSIFISMNPNLRQRRQLMTLLSPARALPVRHSVSYV
jgi:hypothetical protein